MGGVWLGFVGVASGVDDTGTAVARGKSAATPDELQNHRDVERSGESGSGEQMRER